MFIICPDTLEEQYQCVCVCVCVCVRQKEVSMCVYMCSCVSVPSSQYLDDFIILYRPRAACIMEKQCVAVTGDAVNSK